MSIYDLLLLIVFVAYVGATTWKFGILDSISESYYHLKGIWGATFSLFAWGMAIFLAIGHIADSGWFFLPVCMLGLLGAAPFFKDDTVLGYHILGAIGGIATSLSALIIVYHSWLLVALVVVVVWVIYDIGGKNKTWFIEVACFLGIWIGLILK